MRGQVTCEIVNFNKNNFNRKSTKKLQPFLSIVSVWFFLHYFLGFGGEAVSALAFHL